MVRSLHCSAWLRLLSAIPQEGGREAELIGRNYDPNPPLCRITYDSLGHAVALTEAEQHGRAIAPPTPVYAGVKANTPRVRPDFQP